MIGLNQMFETITVNFPLSLILFSFLSIFELDSPGPVTHTLTSYYTGTVVNQDGGENGTKHLEALLRLISTPQLDTQQGENCHCRCLLLPTTWTYEGGRN